MPFNRDLSREWRGTKSQLVPCVTPGCKKYANMYKASGLCFDCIHFCGACGDTKPRGETLCTACADRGEK